MDRKTIQDIVNYKLLGKLPIGVGIDYATNYDYLRWHTGIIKRMGGITKDDMVCIQPIPGGEEIWYPIEDLQIINIRDQIADHE